MNFNEKIEQQHAIPFMKYLENKELPISDLSRTKDRMKTQLSEETLQWFKNKETDLRKFKEFKMKFFFLIFGEIHNNIVQEELFNGKFNPSRGT